MASVRSKRLFGPVLAPPAGATVYTCPAGETALLKTVTFVNNGPIAARARLGINFQNNAGAFLRKTVPAAGDVTVDSIFVVLGPGDFLSLEAEGTSIIVCGFGAELEGVAD